MGDFSPEGTFAGVIERLDHLAHLGVDAIELMPIQEFPGDRSWGYNPAYFFAVEGAYGGAEDLKRLVDAAHQRGIGVILDMVFNHTASDSPLNLLYQYDQNPYFSSDGNPGASRLQPVERRDQAADPGHPGLLAHRVSYRWLPLRLRRGHRL